MIYKYKTNRSLNRILNSLLKKYHGILCYCLSSSGKSNRVMLNMVSLKVEQMADPSGILHSLGRCYQPVSSDIIIYLERF